LAEHRLGNNAAGGNKNRRTRHTITFPDPPKLVFQQEKPSARSQGQLKPNPSAVGRKRLFEKSFSRCRQRVSCRPT
jgi:hypothetical protein